MPKTLLLADDSVTIQKVVGITFANEDIDLVTVDNGDVALERAREIRPDLVLADVAMPGMSGYELCRAIKGDPELAGTPVVLLTGTFETFDAQRAAEVGSNGHITKPFEAQALIDCVNALLEATEESSRTDSTGSDSGVAPPLADAMAPAPQDVPAESAPPPWDASPIQLDEVALEPQEQSFGQPFEFPESPSGDITQEATNAPDPSKTVRHEPSSAPPSEPSLESLGRNLDEALPSTPQMSEEDMGKTAYLEPEPMSAGPASADPNTSQQREYPAMPDPEALTANADTDLPAPTTPPHGRESFQVPPDDPTDASLPGADALFDPTLRAQDLRGQSAPLLDPVPEDLEPTVAAAETAVDMLPEAVANPAPEPQRTPPEETPRLRQEQPAGSATATPNGVAGKIDRDELRGALEKAAWEAFGSISEELVQQTVRRVEEIAWEIVPQIAERLVQEEIERLKDDKPPE